MTFHTPQERLNSERIRQDAIASMQKAVRRHLGMIALGVALLFLGLHVGPKAVTQAAMGAQEAQR